MEVEAKFSVTDRGAWDRLLVADAFGRYKAARGPVRDVEDTYLDTEDWALHHAGYACRLRREGSNWAAWLKGLGGVEGAIHRREELSQSLPRRGSPGPGPDPSTWPEGPVRSRLLELVPGGDLHRIGPLFTLCQTRHLRTLFDGSRAVAELSLDEVGLRRAGPVETYLELEVEALPGARPEEIEILAHLFGDDWGLQPQPLSKHKRALQVLGLSPPAGGAAASAAQTSEVSEDLGSPVGNLAGEERVLATHRPAIENILRLGRPLHQRRARLLLAWDDGADIQALQDCCGYSRSSVYFWLNAYQRDGLGIFPARLVRHATGGVEVVRAAETSETPEDFGTLPDHAADGEASDYEETSEVFEDFRSHPEPLAALMARFDVDPAHARYVADLALRLFDISAAVHRLGGASRGLLEKAALLHNLGLATDPDRHHVAGRDILLEHPVAELTAEERTMVAACIWLHRKAIRPPKLERRWVMNVPDSRRGEMLLLAALVRMADGLDYSGTQTTRVLDQHVSGQTISVTVDGLEAELDASRAAEKADLWDLLREDVRWEFRVPGRPGELPKVFVHGVGDRPLPADPPETDAAVSGMTSEISEVSGAGMTSEVSEVSPHSVSENNISATDLGSQTRPSSPWPPDDPRALLAAEPEPDGPLFGLEQPAAEAARAILRLHAARMLRYEAGARHGRDIEQVHDMRVAVRRMRSAYRLLDEFFEGKEWRRLRSGLQRTAGALGHVRDLDVLIDHAEKYAAEHAGPGVEPLLDTWRAHRADARAALIEWLDGNRYHRFTGELVQFVSSPGCAARPVEAESPWPARVADAAPRLIYTALGRVRAYEPFLAAPPLATLHALRIDCKRFRYTLEFFRPLMGDEAKEAIEATVAAQNHLGNLHDADVAERLVRDFLDGGSAGPEALDGSTRRACGRRVLAPGVVQYLAARQVEMQELVSGFPAVWSRLTGPDGRRALALAVARL